MTNKSKEPVAELHPQFSSDSLRLHHGRRGASSWRRRKFTGWRLCARTDAHMSLLCCAFGWTVRCISAPAPESAKLRTLWTTRTV